MLLFPAPTNPLRKMEDTRIPRFDTTRDPEGVASYVPHMDHFYDNSIQSAQMRDLAVDFELLDEHLVLLGNQVRFNVNDTYLRSAKQSRRAWAKIRSSIGYAR